MCNPEFNPHLGPVTKTQATELQSMYPLQSTFIKDIYTAMTYGLAPQTNLLVMFTLLRHQYQQRMSGGILEKFRLLYVPLSIVAKTDERIWTRFRPKPVKELHISFLSFMMAETNRNAVNTVCNKYGIAFGQGHCCGVLFGTPEDIRIYQESNLYHQRNLLRSSIESLAMPVTNEIPLDEIPENNIDLGMTEREFFEQYEDTMKKLSLPSCIEEIPTDFMVSINRAWEKVLSLTPTAEPLSA